MGSSEESKAQQLGPLGEAGPGLCELREDGWRVGFQVSACTDQAPTDSLPIQMKKS